MKIRELPEWEMPREKLLRYGKQKLSAAELLAILLRTGSAERSAVDLANELLSLDKKGLRFIAESRRKNCQRSRGSERQRPVRYWRLSNWDGGSHPRRSTGTHVSEVPAKMFQ